MNWFLWLVWLVALCYIPVNQSVSVPDRSSCRVDDIKLKEDFNVKKFTGKWYDIGRLETANHQSDLQFGYSHFILTDEGKLEMHYVGEIAGECQSPVTGVSDTFWGPRFDFSFLAGQSPVGPVSGPHWVVDTDYNNYAIIYGCYNRQEDGSCTEDYGMVHIMGRHKSIGTTQRVKLEYLLEHKLCLDSAKMRYTQHKIECSMDQPKTLLNKWEMLNDDIGVVATPEAVAEEVVEQIEGGKEFMGEEEDHADKPEMHEYYSGEGNMEGAAKGTKMHSIQMKDMGWEESPGNRFEVTLQESPDPLPGNVLPYLLLELADNRTPELEGTGCNCAQGVCKCCVTIKLPIVGSHKVCASAGLVRQNVGLAVELALDGKVLFRKEISAKNPPDICVGIKFMVKVCLKVYDIKIPPPGFGACFELKAKVAGATVGKFKLGCFSQMDKSKVDILTELAIENIKMKQIVMKEELAEMRRELKSLNKTQITPVAFSVYIQEGNIHPDNEDTVKFTGVEINVGGHYNSSDGVFTCPIDGIYFFTYAFNAYLENAKSMRVELVVQGRHVAGIYCRNDNSNTRNVCGNTAIVHCNKGDAVFLRSLFSDNELWGQFASRGSTFSGMLQYADPVPLL